ncbi:VOC family protein [Cognatishimia sp. F0-27]|uniref:VOC family protein n=1 Tax=Cognatishimia sp. F0-27 TaxID=2816855 RepID=UPI001D0C74C3|nr:VOC family protein [Cognatishimia sp. F0-27]MCC1493303.1 VOC family protein [Cognatishimia sp. F0-27]
MLELDHIAVAGETLGAATAHVEDCLGQPMGPGGQHAHFATHNRLLGMEPALYLEAIAIDPTVPRPPYARWFGLDAFRGAPRLDKWILRTDDLDAAIHALPMAGEAVALSRGNLRWSMAVPRDGMLPFDGLFPALIQWHSDTPPGLSLAKPALSMSGLTVRHPEAEALRALLDPYLDAPLVSFETGAPGLEATLQSLGRTVTLR